MWRLAFISILFFGGSAIRAEQPTSVPISELGSKYELVGKLHVPFGKVVVLQGVIVDGPFIGYEGGPNLRVQRIDGVATQEDIQIQVLPYFGEFGKKRHDGKELPKLEFGKSYEMEGYESGRYVGVPDEAYRRAGLEIQTSGFYFQQYFDVYRAKQIEPVVFSPADFIGREALLEGKASNEDHRSYIIGNGWKLMVTPKVEWPKEMADKVVEGLGKVKKFERPNEYQLVDAKTRLVSLQDQVGRNVELRGTIWTSNGHCWLEYRGTKLYVENMTKLPGFSYDLHAKPVLIIGKLDEAMMPDIEQITLKEKPDSKKYYIVRDASLKPLDRLLSSERADQDN